MVERSVKGNDYEGRRRTAAVDDCSADLGGPRRQRRRLQGVCVRARCMWVLRPLQMTMARRQTTATTTTTRNLNNGEATFAGTWCLCVGAAAAVPRGMNVGVDPASATHDNGLALNCDDNDCSAQIAEKEDASLSTLNTLHMRNLFRCRLHVCHRHCR